MGEWRYYTQRASTGRWLDTNTQIEEVGLDWMLSGPAGGQAYVPSGLATNPVAEDGRLTWGKWDSILYAEEDAKLAWAGICVAANPDSKGLKLEFTGPTGWLQGVPFGGHIAVWKTNAFDVARALIAHSRTYPNALQFDTGSNLSAFTVGDPQPPNRPKEPARRKGETKAEWQSSDRYDKWQIAAQNWDDKYGDRKRWEIAWWESPYVGEEFSSLAKEVGFDYQERVRWADRSALRPQFHIDLSDEIRRRRDDIKLVDGMNLAKALEAKDNDDIYANRVIGLGAGEGRDMLKTEVGGDDGRLYQAEYVQYKTVNNLARLRGLVQADHKKYSNLDPEVDNVVAWDVPGYASLSGLRCGDEVEVISQNTNPPIATWRRVVEISRNPVESIVQIGLESV